MDKNLFFALFGILIFGVIMVLSASFPEYGFSKFKSQIFFIVVALVVAIPFVRGWFGLGSDFLYNHSRFFYWLTFLLLLLVFTPIDGNTVNGSTRWIALLGFKVQPSEIAKLVIVISMAKMLVKYKTHDSKGTILTILLLAPFVLVIMLETDIGATLLIILTAAVMVFVAGTKLRYLFSIGAILLIFLALLVYFSLDNRVDRITAFLTGEGEMDTQRAIAMLGVFRAGWFGVGIGASLQKYSLPEAHNDMILAIIGEELGGVGLLLLLLLYSYIYYKGFKISHQALKIGRYFQSHLAFGISFILTLQTLLNFSVNLSLVPPKGVTLPLVSYGGSSMLMTVIMLAILLKIDIENKKCKRF